VLTSNVRRVAKFGLDDLAPLHDGKRKAGDVLLTHFRFDVLVHFVSLCTGVDG
jgi:hypothetical protein